MQLIAGCEQRWDDARAWRMHLLGGMQTLFQTQVAIWVEAAGVDKQHRPQHVELATAGWPNRRARAKFLEYLAHGGPAMMPDFRLVTRYVVDRGYYTGRRRDHVPDRHWYDSQAYQDYIKPMGMDDYVVSMRVSPRLGTTSSLSVHRLTDDEPFEPRHRRLLALLHAELVPRLGITLAMQRQMGVHNLTPRQRQTLRYLQQGHSEKEVASRLGISPTTVHGYVGELYHHFMVSSRAELLAYLFSRKPRPLPENMKRPGQT